MSGNADQLRTLVEDSTRDYFAEWAPDGPQVSTEVADVDYLDAVQPELFLGGWIAVYQQGNIATDVEFAFVGAQVLVFADDETAGLAFHNPDADVAGAEELPDVRQIGDETSGVRYGDELQELILSFRAGSTRVVLNWNATPAFANEQDFGLMEDIASGLCGAIAASSDDT